CLYKSISTVFSGCSSTPCKANLAGCLTNRLALRHPGKTPCDSQQRRPDDLSIPAPPQAAEPATLVWFKPACIPTAYHRSVRHGSSRHGKPRSVAARSVPALPTWGKTMKKLLPFLLLLAFSSNAFALNLYDSLSEPQKSVLTTIVTQLGIKDDDNSIKEKLYNESSFIFEERWSSYWTGLNELARSNYKDGKEKGFIELALNNSKHGTVFLTYIHKPEAKQIILVARQIRHGSSSLVLEEFGKRKADTDKYEL